MQLRCDWSERIVVDSSGMDWAGSPAAGVQRKLLERDGDEVARATPVARYAPGSHFSRQVHAPGEELFLLDGEFCAGSGRFGPGSYIYNPPGSAYAPWADGGCVLFVKLRYFDPLDRAGGGTYPRPALVAGPGTGAVGDVAARKQCPYRRHRTTGEMP
jgi:anti-sigma factor ChrR (cupin superfamily)